MIKSNQKEIGVTDEFKSFSEEFDKNIEFLESFSELIALSGRMITFISDNKFHRINTLLLENSSKTLKSIKLCCSIGSFSDANTLTRKLRDDLLLYVYILDVVNKREPFFNKETDSLNLENPESFSKSFLSLKFNSDLTNDEKAISAWLENNVSELPKNIKMKLSFENYMKYLKQNNNIENVIREYNLQNYWEQLTKKLNNYVHNNGSQFSSHNLVKYPNTNLEVFLKNVNTRCSYILTFFLILILMTESALLSSGEIMDYFDLGLDPPENIQYEIAPFLQNYIDEKVMVLHPELKQYLKDNNNYGMRIE